MMPLYFFDIYNDDITLDDEGAELADKAAAVAHAIKGARALAAETVLHGHFVGNHRIEIVGAERNPVDTVTFADAVVVNASATDSDTSPRLRGH